LVHILLGIIYLAFIGLGLPDGLLGAGWPVMQPALSVPVSYAGLVSIIISIGTITSSLLSDRLTRRLGCGKVTVISVGLTAAALFGFSASNSFWMLCLWAIPYGLGAGGVDAALNNYVALHYASRHMSWLHCMWGVGASVGPYIMGFALTGGYGWPAGYQIVGAVQAAIVLALIFSLPFWKQRPESDAAPETGGKPLKLSQICAIPGAKEVFLMFFCYCALESTAGLWAASYLIRANHIEAEQAASLASLFYIGITAGRAVSGFVTMKLNDKQMIWLGMGILAAGVAILLLPLGLWSSVAGLLLIGLGCAPIYPCVIHSTPAHFGTDRSQAIIGVQMASAYFGSLSMPPLFGIFAQFVGAQWMPVYIGLILALMAAMHQRLNKVCPIA